MAPANRSRVWDYFQTLNDDTVTCKLCHQVLQKPASSSTSNFTRHLRSRHALNLARTSSIDVKPEGSRAPSVTSDDRDDERPSSSTPPGTAHRSRVWLYIQSLSADSGMCRLCQKVLKTSHSSSSNFTRHLQTKHGVDIHRPVDPSVHAHPPINPPSSSESSEPPVKAVPCADHRAYRSWVWRYFEAVSPLAGICQLCLRTLKNGHASTSNFARHLRSNHGITEENHLDPPAMDDEAFPKRLASSQQPRMVRSGAWQYFSQLSETEFKCALCQQVLKASRFSSTSNFMRHLKCKHDIVPTTIVSPKREMMKEEEEEEKKNEDQRNREQLVAIQQITSEPKTWSSRVSGPRTKSMVWQYFVSLTAEAAICQLCQSIFKINGASTSSLIKHLRTKHEICLKSANKVDDDRPSISPKGLEENDKKDVIPLSETMEMCPDQIEVASFKVVIPDQKLGEGRMHRSLVWNYFQELTDRSAVCNLCSKVIRTSNSSTSNLTRHLKTKHEINVTEEAQKDEGLLKNWLKDQRRDSESTDKAEWHVEDLMQTILVQEQSNAPRVDVKSPVESMDDDRPEDIWDDTKGNSPESTNREEPSEESEETETENEAKMLKSPVWDYFQQLTSEAAICKICQSILSLYRSTTSNLLRHLRRQHEIIIQPEPLPMTPKADQASSQPARRSEVWRHYEPHPSGGMKCRLCDTVQRSSDKSSNFFRHLRSKHGVVIGPRRPHELVGPANT